MNRLLMGSAAAATLGFLAMGTGSASAADGPQGGSMEAPHCRTAQLSAELSRVDAGAGQRYSRLIFKNVSRHSCRVYGWPRLQLGRDHAPIPTSVHRQGRPRTITLRPGQHAYSQLHWTVIPTGGEPAGHCEPTPTWLRVMPPATVRYIQLRWHNGPVCDHGRFDTNALAPGTGA